MLKCEIWLLSHPIRQHDCACLLLMAFWFITVLPANPGGGDFTRRHFSSTWTVNDNDILTRLFCKISAASKRNAFHTRVIF